MSQPPDPASGSVRLSPFLKHRRALGLGLAFFVALVVHQPLLRWAISLALHETATAMGLAFTAKLSGNPLKGCVLENIQVQASKPTHALASTLSALSVRRLEAEFDFLGLLKLGPKGYISSVKAEGILVRLHEPPPSPTDKPEGAPSKKKPLGGTLAKLPSFAPDSFELRDVSVVYEKNGSPFVSISGASLSAFPNVAGELRVGSLQFQDHPALTDLRAATRYRERNFTVVNLPLSPAVEIQEIQCDASRHLSQEKTVASLHLRSASGSLQATLNTGADLGKWEAHLNASHFSTGSLAEFLGDAGRWIPSELSAKVDLSGSPSAPHEWAGGIQVDWSQALPLGKSGEFTATATVANGVLRIEKFEAESGASHITGTGHFNFAVQGDPAKPLSGEAFLELSSKDLGAWLPQKSGTGASGSALASVLVQLKKGALQLECTAQAQDVDAGSFKAEQCAVEATVLTPVSQALHLESLAGNGVVTLQRPSYTDGNVGVVFEEIKSAVSLEGGVARFWNLHIKNDENRIGGEVWWPFLSKGTSPKCRVDFQLNDMEKTRLLVRSCRVLGTLEGTLEGSLENGLFQGALTASGRNLSWGAFQLGEFRAKSTCDKGTLHVEELSMAWAPQEGMHATGTLSLSAPFQYEVDAVARVPKLEKLSAFFSQLGMARQVGGALSFQWKGNGVLNPPSGTGVWDLRLKDCHWDNIKLNAVECAGRYEPGLLTSAPIKITTPTAKLGAQVEWAESTLRIQNIALEQWGTPTLSGYLMLPLARDASGIHWIEDARLAGQLRAERLDIANLLAGAGKPATLAGTVYCSLAISGTATSPSAAFNLQAKEIRFQSSPKFGPLELDLKGSFAGGAIDSEATLRSPLAAPVRAELKLPVPLAALLADFGSIRNLPLEAHFHTVNASLSPLLRLWSGLRQLSGTASADITLRGTLNDPKWKGALQVDCPILHFSSDRVPAIADLHGNAEFEGKQLRIPSLKADLGGGSLLIHGAMVFSEPGNPSLDFNAKAREVLAVRNPNLSIRLNGDLSLRGSWKKAVIGGHASAVKSQVRRDIDILPVNSLLQGAVREQRPSGKPWFTFQRAPFSDWRFDVSLATTPGDPIILRGNRLRGTADAELKLEGTGAAPTLHGAYRTSDIIASLPFARVEVSRGRVWFTRDRPFLPQIDFSAETESRNHRVRIYLSGSPEAPNVTASSEPPLGETDLLALLTTGALPNDANESSQGLTGRAATVLFQEFSDKVFKPNNNKERPMSLRRFNLDLGAVNGRTGHQESRLTYRLNNNLFLIGEVGADGDFAGRVRYVLRFR